MTPAADPAWLRKRHRLHPLSIFFPFRSYARPQRLGGSGALAWLVVAGLLGLILLINLDVANIRTSTTELIADTSISSSDGGISIDVASDRDLARPLEIGLWVVLAALLIAIPVSAAYFVIRWWTFRWWIEEGAIRTCGGLLNTWSRQVLIVDIVTIERAADPVRRLLRVTTLTIETSAVDATPANVLLDWLPGRDADRLTHALLGERGDTPAPVRMLSERPPSPLDLIAASAFNVQLTRTALTLYAAYSLLVRLAPDAWLPSWLIELRITIDTEKQGVIGAMLPVAGMLLALWLSSVLIFVLTFARFRLAQQGSWLRMQGGAIRRRQRWIRASAIQGLELVESPAQRPTGSVTLRMRMLVHGASQLNQMVLHPSIRRTALVALLEPIVGLDHDARVALMRQTLTPLPAASRAAYFLTWSVRTIGLSVIVGLIALSSERDYWWVALLPLVAIIPLNTARYLAWKRAGWHVSDQRWIMVRNGRINTTTVIAHVSRIAYLTWSHSLFSRVPIRLVTLALSNPTSGEARLIDRILARLHRGTPPSMVTLKYLTVPDALVFAERSGISRSLPPELFADGAPAGGDRDVARWPRSRPVADQAPEVASGTATATPYLDPAEMPAASDGGT